MVLLILFTVSARCHCVFNSSISSIDPFTRTKVSCLSKLNVWRKMLLVSSLSKLYSSISYGWFSWSSSESLCLWPPQTFHGDFVWYCTKLTINYTKLILRRKKNYSVFWILSSYLFVLCTLGKNDTFYDITNFNNCYDHINCIYIWINRWTKK